MRCNSTVRPAGTRRRGSLTAFTLICAGKYKVGSIARVPCSVLVDRGEPAVTTTRRPVPNERGTQDTPRHRNGTTVAAWRCSHSR
ncbi:hypothetical protein V5799_028656 [Amblyomma americanum]|uniref:Uncharacterized protein n=1 Tax=Amblyomma americanum TaxID=6943 RepID=A0AAQ4DC85_AMBAM